MSCTINIQDNINIYKGNTKKININVTNGEDDDGNEVPFILTDYKIYLIVKNSKYDDNEDAVINKEGVVVSETLGTGYVQLVQTDTDIKQKKYIYYIRVVKNDNSFDEYAAEGILEIM